MSDNAYGTRLFVTIIFVIIIIPLAVQLILSWAQLPDQIIIQFHSGEPSDRMGKGYFTFLMLLLLISQLPICNWIVSYFSESRFLPSIVGIMFFFTIGIELIFWFIIDYNLNGTPFKVIKIVIISLCGSIFTFLVTYLINKDKGKIENRMHSKRESKKALFILKHHSSGTPLFIIIFLNVLITIVLFMCSGDQCKIILAITLLGSIYTSISMLYGYEYRFFEDGIEVFGLFQSLMFIPVSQIEYFHIKSIKPFQDFGGWGVRYGMNSKAFVLGGNTAVCIEIKTKKIFLGSDRPEQIVKIIELIKKSGK